ncbi:MAG: hypothetical protein U0794_01130 [Isosphaeraceae bacterium]
MNDPLTWSPISLGRWAGTHVRIHISLILFAAITLLGAAIGTGHRVVPTVAWLGLLLVALLIHELGHALAAAWLNVDPDEVRLWPLGNVIGPPGPGRSMGNDHIIVSVAGLAMSAAMVLVAAVVLSFLDAQIVLNPIGNKEDAGAPLVTFLNPDHSVDHRLAKALTPVWYLGWFGYLNWVILLANLIPALPFDGGRICRAYVAQTSMSQGLDSLIPPVLARSFAIILAIAGLFLLLLSGRGEGLTLISLAIVIEWMVRLEARMIEEGGYLEEGLFGYDFSQGYTSLEGGKATIRPRRENALKRWRRRRSELRRQRRAAQEAAEERRMDEILEKLHTAGRSALTEEENRFLVRVSARYRNRPRGDA